MPCRLLAWTLVAFGLAASPRAEGALTLPWIVDATRARDLIASGALVLDARQDGRGRIKGAVQVDWRAFAPRQGAGRGGLLGARALTRRLRGLGVRQEQPVLVFGDPLGGWGEEGRIVWMLRALGHQAVAMVDGGYRALRKVGVTRARTADRAGDFTAQTPLRFWASREDVRRRLAQRDAVVLVDARQRREYDGETPYGERRGGHLPGAVHLHHKSLLDANGYLLPRRRLQARLKALGISPQRFVIVYCSGGVRSAWLVAVLASLSYHQLANYAGSTWEWSAGSVARYPLEM